MLDQELIRGAVTLIAVFLGATLAFAFGVWRTRHERRWNARNDAYREIFVALEDVRSWGVETANSGFMLPSIVGSNGEELNARRGEAIRRLYSYAHGLSYVIGVDVRKELEALLDSLDAEVRRHDDHDPPGEYDEHGQAYAQHVAKIAELVGDKIPDLQRLAAKDLGRWRY